MHRLFAIVGLLAAGVLSGAPSAAFAQSDLQPIPTLEKRVTDVADILPAPAESALEEKLAAFEARKGAQIAVLIVASTAPEEIEQYSIRVVDAWKLGRQRVDDGALLIVAVDDRRLRIEVGRGLEGVLTDLVSNRIIQETITPRFRSGDYAGGIDAGVDRMIAVVDGEPLPEPEQAWEGESSGGFEEILGIVFVVAVILSAILRKVLGRILGAVTTGGVLGALGMLITGALGLALLAGFVGFVVGLAGGVPTGRFATHRGRGRWDGGFGGGGFGGGGFGGGGFGGGGFGGLGGGFGGGGASGSW